MKPAREARKGGVWLFERRLTREYRRDIVNGTAWELAYQAPETKRVVARDKSRMMSGDVYEYRPTLYVPANPRRSTRGKRK